jgi:hypothetical protein
MVDLYPELKQSILEQIPDTAAMDETVIDEILFNIHLASVAKESIMTDGFMQNVSTNPKKPYYQVSGAVSVYTTAVKNINSLCTLIGIDKKSRKLIVDIANKQTEKDELDLILAEDNE